MSGMRIDPFRPEYRELPLAASSTENFFMVAGILLGLGGLASWLCLSNLKAGQMASWKELGGQLGLGLGGAGVAALGVKTALAVQRRGNLQPGNPNALPDGDDDLPDPGQAAAQSSDNHPLADCVAGIQSRGLVERLKGVHKATPEDELAQILIAVHKDTGPAASRPAIYWRVLEQAGIDFVMGERENEEERARISRLGLALGAASLPLEMIPDLRIWFYEGMSAGIIQHALTTQQPELIRALYGALSDPQREVIRKRLRTDIAELCIASPWVLEAMWRGFMDLKKTPVGEQTFNSLLPIWEEILGTLGPQKFEALQQRVAVLGEAPLPSPPAPTASAAPVEPPAKPANGGAIAIIQNADLRSRLENVSGKRLTYREIASLLVAIHQDAGSHPPEEAYTEFLKKIDCESGMAAHLIGFQLAVIHAPPQMLSGLNLWDRSEMRAGFLERASDENQESLIETLFEVIPGGADVIMKELVQSIKSLQSNEKCLEAAWRGCSPPRVHAPIHIVWEQTLGKQAFEKLKARVAAARNSAHK